MPGPAEAVKQLQDAITIHFERELTRRPKYDPRNIYASGFYPCARRLYHDLHDHKSRQPFEVHQLIRFRRGEAREVDWAAWLGDMGKRADPPFQVIGQQERFQVNGRDGLPLLSGKLDWRIKYQDGSKPPVEAKAWRDSTWDSVKSIEQVREGRWTRGGFYQLLSYLYGTGEEYGMMFLDGPGFPKVFPLVLEDHLDDMERFLTLAEIAMKHHREDLGPPQGVDRPDLCSWCWACGRVCFPNLEAGPGLRIVTEDSLAEDLNTLHGPACQRCREGVTVAEVLDRGGRLDKRVKEAWRGMVTQDGALCGGFYLRGRWTRFRGKEKGRFLLQVERVKAKGGDDGAET